MPVIDLFASRINFKFKIFYSRFPDPGSEAVDTFTVVWDKFSSAFLPFALISAVLRKIIRDKTLCILVVPLWPSQTWYPIFSSLLIEEPMYFDPDPNLLISPCRTERHPLFKSLSLVAGKYFGGLTRIDS